jgi:predicted Zn-dependent protease with MMP-like domain
LPDIVLFPSADLHAVIGGPPLVMRVAYRERDPADPTAYTLEDVTNRASFAFFAPYAEGADRFPDDRPRVDFHVGPNLGRVTATRPGTYLFQIRYQRPGGDNHAIVGRLQVHRGIRAWWFGSRTITTAVDRFAHAQPSIYAEFDDDMANTDVAEVVGDITGHDWVVLTSDAPLQIEVADRGRLRGLVLSGPVTITGRFVGAPLDGTTDTMTARAVNYDQQRDELEVVRATDLSDPTMLNILFLSEGFQDTDADRKLFNDVVTTATDKLFSDSRHQPYGMLSGSFNVFKHFVPSVDTATTLGYRFTEVRMDTVPRGRAIPYSKYPAGRQRYSVDQLIRLVGLPRHDDTTPAIDIITHWRHQDLADYQENQVNEDLVRAWLGQYQHSIVNTADTFFGLYHGVRPGDRHSDTHGVGQADEDSDADEVRAFQRKLYEFWPGDEEVTMNLDPRRHPPERFDDEGIGLGSSIMRYIAGLRTVGTQLPFGQVWVPDPDHFKPSRGLVAVIVRDVLDGGTSILADSMVVLTLDNLHLVHTTYTDTTARRQLTRDALTDLKPDVREVVDTLAHEFGHAFNLADEYEHNPGDDPQASDTDEFVYDNLTSLGRIQRPGQPAGDRHLDPSRVKWLELPRMILSSRLVRDTVASAAGIVVPLEHHQMSDWKRARKWNHRPSLLRLDLSSVGQRLPLGTGPTNILTDLTIVDLDEANATMTLGGPNLPQPPPVFPIGSVVYLPNPDNPTVLKPQVLAVLQQTGLPINADTDHQNPRDKPDSPVKIPGLRMPCHEQEVVGVYEGGHNYAGGMYRPTGECKMRAQSGKEDAGEFCFVCKWLIVNRADAGLHAHLDRDYPEKSCGG